MNARLQGRFGLGLDPLQARLVHAALVELPWRTVHALVARLEEWMAHPGAPFALDADELALVLEALANLPYRRVHGLIASLRGQLAAVDGGQP
ncbi:hypothetical protein [Pseudoduganella chitinolytica]|uniref:Uncharacterized protein n=1 Tax=Pseudoduganella chitinolytica TaxID=34070 RepID=A0ABY8BH90_9BURK|nr:hypothetical protein [Pseudoduganella chitinolytica]WEF34311.1 hypothetical protein PX653_05930 [Pseudoduganella chitinolytica]